MTALNNVPDPSQVNYTVYLDKKGCDYDVVRNVTKFVGAEGSYIFYTNDDREFPTHVYPVRQVYRIRKHEVSA